MGKIADFIQARKGKPLDLADYLAKLKSRGLAADGRQLPDPVPLAPPIGYKKQPSMVEIVREMVRSERLKMEAEAAGHETFEESEDFEVDDDGPDLKSGWENDFDPPIAEIAREVEASKPKPPPKPADGPQGGGGAEPPSDKKTEP